jgi:REP element-mobilizing transposase RayT
MGATYSKILLHFAFSTKHRTPLITPELQPRLYEYLGGTIRGEKGALFAIGGMPDHLHLLIRWRPDESISNLMRKLKGNSSSWVHKTFPAMKSFAWQEGYGVFSVSKSQEDAVKRYIETQERHHRKLDFKEEYLALLKAHGVEYDERYIWE